MPRDTMVISPEAVLVRLVLQMQRKARLRSRVTGRVYLPTYRRSIGWWDFLLGRRRWPPRSGVTPTFEPLHSEAPRPPRCARYCHRRASSRKSRWWEEASNLVGRKNVAESQLTHDQAMHRAVLVSTDTNRVDDKRPRPRVKAARLLLRE